MVPFFDVIVMLFVTWIQAGDSPILCNSRAILSAGSNGLFMGNGVGNYYHLCAQILIL